MTNITIKQKLIGLVGIVFTVFIIFSAVYMYGASMNAKVSSESRRDMVIKEAETGARIAILQARENEKDFLLNKNDDYIKQHSETMKHLYELLEILQNNIRSEDGLDAVKRLTNLSHEYEKGFKSMAAVMIKVGLNEKSGLLGGLLGSAHEIEGLLNKYENDKLIITMLMMRRYEKDYFASGDEKDIGRMAERKGKFGVLLQESGFPKLVRRDIRAGMNSYHNDFNALVRGMREVKQAIEIFHKNILATKPAFDRVEQVVHELRQSNEIFYEESNRRVALLYVLAMIFGGIVIVVSVLLLTRDLSRGLDRAVQVGEDVSEGKLGLNIESKSTDEIGQLLLSLRKMDENLLHVVTEVQGSVHSIGSAAKQIAQGNASLSQRTEEQASSLEETSTSMEEMTSTVRQNADNANEARKLVEAYQQKAADGELVISRTVAAMSDINTSSNKITEIIGTIDSIAFQTNLLALNAAVEAARAGEQGRGFAVVAAEVRTLAQRSAEAAKEINVLITDSVAKVEIGTELVDESGKTLKEIIEGIQDVTNIVTEIASTSNEQASGIDQVNVAIAQMDMMTQENAGLVEEATASSQAMQDQACSLNDLVSFFQVDKHSGRPSSEGIHQKNQSELYITGENDPSGSVEDIGDDQEWGLKRSA